MKPSETRTGVAEATPGQLLRLTDLVLSRKIGEADLALLIRWTDGTETYPNGAVGLIFGLNTYPPTGSVPA